jgi:NAD(P)-dependent dehydrogenase (short-subunit alcohol dehydrogenase family)
MGNEMSQQQPICVITGVGPGTGSALTRRFAKGGYRVAMLARNNDRLTALEREVPEAKGFVCDVSDPAQVTRAIDAVESTLGEPRVLIHNAVGGAWGSFLEIEPSVLNDNFQTNTMGLLYLARRLAPAMVAAGSGTILVTGNTSALRGRANFAGFAPTKAAQRILAEAMARELGPKGVHVAYLVIDAVIDVPWARERLSQKPDDFFVKPTALAEELWHIAHQDRSAWSFNVEVRPYGETW